MVKIGALHRDGGRPQLPDIISGSKPLAGDDLLAWLAASGDAASALIGIGGVANTDGLANDHPRRHVERCLDMILTVRAGREPAGT